MDIERAIQAHTDRKLRLLNLARGKTDVRGAGPPPALPEFAGLFEAQEAFEACARDALALIEAGKGREAESRIVSAKSQFNRLSIRIVGLLMDLADRADGPYATILTSETDTQANRDPMAAPATTSLRKCIPSRMREAAMLSAQKISPVPSSG